VKELQAIFRDLKKQSQRIKSELAARDFFDTRPFQELVVAARYFAFKRIRSLQRKLPR